MCTAVLPIWPTAERPLLGIHPEKQTAAFQPDSHRHLDVSGHIDYILSMTLNNSFSHPASVLALETFRLNGALVALGDSLVAPLGLTSARWQVMGAIAEAGGALPVAGLARNMGLVRQSVQRIANELAAAGLVRFAPNPHHRRAKLVQLTESGAALFEEATARWLATGEVLIDEIGREEAERGAAFLGHLRASVQALRTKAADGAEFSPGASEAAP